jgi:Asp/Glu/hydantoin racemase
MVKILVISPGYRKDCYGYLEKIDDISSDYNKVGLIIHKTSLPGRGEPHFPYCRVEAFYHTDLLKTVKEAELKGYDAVVINCASDPELEEAQSLVKIPVVAPLNASAHVASMIARRFSVILNRKGRLYYRQDKLRSYGLEEKVASYKIAKIDYPSEETINDLMIKDEVKLRQITKKLFIKLYKTPYQI